MGSACLAMCRDCFALDPYGDRSLRICICAVALADGQIPISLLGHSGTCTQRYICILVDVHQRMHIHVYMYIYMYLYMYIYMYIYVYIEREGVVLCTYMVRYAYV